MNKLKKKILILPIVVALISILSLVAFSFIYEPISYKPYNTFLNDLASNSVESVYYTTSPKITVKIANNVYYETDNPRVDTFKESILTQGVEVLEQSYMSPLKIIPIVLLGSSVGFILIFMIKGSNLSKGKLKSVDSLHAEAVEEMTLNFESVAGNEEAKESVMDVVDFLKNPEKYSSYGAKMPRGVILYGEPGTGKTLLAKAVAGEANVPFYAVSGSDFIQVYVGVGASRIRQLFKKAKSHGKAVIFIDEIDAIGKKRSGNASGGSDERDQTLNALLTEMSGFAEKEGIVVMAATNRLDMLDDALLRPGRFDRHIEVSLPDVQAREKILNLHMKNKPFDKININDWAKKTSYFSGAKLEHLVNEAAIFACKDESPLIEDIHLDSAFNVVVAGHEKKNRSHIREEDRKITAYHEAGHALISLIVLPEEKVSKVTIIPTTKGAGGYTMSIPEDKLYQNKEYILNRIMVLLGGRAAEEILFGKEKITTGASSDLKRTTNTIRNMITTYGMGDSLGLLTEEELGDLSHHHKMAILDECKNTVDTLYASVKDILKENMESLHCISNNLLEYETLDEEKLINCTIKNSENKKLKEI
ncbi:ATP-dependent metallopeptidase FtsH/Yme1/Tma family protein [Clostridium grantii]|uniref:ATP-dependent zinc metalloprotease FtsH n=1 Tax=Clostridium grantii DSM 8605 TaxID=1121316 RepID=A0A1M5UWA5_9CLOT|nr:FtsH/Yme1/Tma family ATP-dependent metallopeptidase [Clostridium grantii]SHH67206.1 cell division protease FtsH [Clostridium grantii DSM 8605]